VHFFIQDRGQHFCGLTETSHCVRVVLKFGAVHEDAIEDHAHAMQAVDEVVGGEVQEKQAAGSEAIAAAREQISQIDTVERLEAERQVWQQVLAGDQLTAAQRVEVERSLNQTIAGITRKGAAEKQTIARQDAAADIEIARLQVEIAKGAIDLSSAADKTAADQKLARLRQLKAPNLAPLPVSEPPSPKVHERAAPRMTTRTRTRVAAPVDQPECAAAAQ
jgi:hypothetical protein